MGHFIIKCNISIEFDSGSELTFLGYIRHANQKLLLILEKFGELKSIMEECYVTIREQFPYNQKLILL